MIVRGIDPPRPSHAALRLLQLPQGVQAARFREGRRRGRGPAAATVSVPRVRPADGGHGARLRAPPQRDRTGWLVAELLQSFGVIFEPGICGPGYRPRRLREAVAFLAERGHDAGVVQQRARQLRRAHRE